MKGKSFINENHIVKIVLPSGCWIPTRPGRQKSFKRLIERYQKEIDVTLAGTVIGLMLLTSIWGVLVQLAEF